MPEEPIKIAVIGMACRLPGGVDSPAEFWNLLCERRDVIQDTPPERFDAGRYFHPNPEKGRLYTQAGGFLDQVDGFDAAFFGVSPREAVSMDPQQRLVLELAWEALEDAGVVSHELAGSSASVFIGVSNSDYSRSARPQARASTAYTNSGGALSIVANRVSYTLDLHGASVAIDTACSSALVAVHEAAKSLAAGDSKIALVGGVNILLDPGISLGFARAAMLSPTGRCHSFSEDADGYVRSEGGGLVVLKRLEDAEAAGDRIRAVILATAVNSDGRTQGLALPSAQAQEDLLRTVYDRSGVDAGTVDYVEAHGTGTLAGDPLECEALGNALGGRRGGPLQIGSVKSNVGHLEAAAGIVGLIKVVLSLQHRRLAPSIHCLERNSQIPWDDLNLDVVRELKELDTSKPLVMGVNSFGFGGTNAHAVLTEYAHACRDDDLPEDENRAPTILLLSAARAEALPAIARRYATALGRPDAPSLAATCRTAARHRTHHPWRAALRAPNREEMVEQLQAFAGGDRVAGLVSGRARSSEPRTAFVFSGNGSQWPGMALGLIRHDPRFLASIERIDSVLRPMLGWSLVEELGRPDAEARLERTEIAQPLLFGIQVALVDCFRSLGLVADAVIGHSVGEIAAAYTAGALSLSDACRVVVERSRGQARTAGRGRMAAVGMSAEQAIEDLSELRQGLTIAGINSWHSITLAGDAATLDALGQKLEAEGIFYRELGLDYAFHSPAMDEIEGDLIQSLAGLRPRTGPLPFYSTVTGTELPGEQLGARYWWDNIRQPVRLAEGIQSLLESGVSVFLEVGPHPILRAYLRECTETLDDPPALLSSLTRNTDDRDAVLSTVASCYVAGASINFRELFPAVGLPAALPTYPWQRERYWAPHAETELSLSPLLGRRVHSLAPIFRSHLDPEWPAYLSDHCIDGVTVFPASGFIELALAAARDVLGPRCALQDLEIERPLIFTGGASREIEVHLSPEEGTLRIVSRVSENSTATNATARIATSLEVEAAKVSIPALMDALSHRTSSEEHYHACSERGIEYGPAFRGVEEIYSAPGEALGRIASPADGEAASYCAHPALLDACFQVAFAMLDSPDTERPDDAEPLPTYLPVGVGRVSLVQDSVSETCRYAWCRLRRGARLEFDITLLDEEGSRLLEIEGLRARRMPRRPVARPATYEWKPRLLEGAPTASLDIDPASLIQAASKRVATPAAQLRAERYYGTVRGQLNELILAFAQRAVAGLTQGTASFNVNSLVDAGVVVASQRRFFDYLVGLLEQAGVVHAAGSNWVMDSKPRLSDPNANWREIFWGHPECYPELQMIARSGRSLEAVLQGDKDPLQAIHPVESSGLVEHLFEAGNVLRTYNEIAVEAVRGIVAEWPKRSVLRVLEIGGGTGGLTSLLLPVLPPERTKYTFSDVGHLFVERAERRFANYEFLRTSLLDIAQDPVEQGLPQAGFDLVVAANVLHATADLRSTLSNVRRLLAPGGLLLLLETHSDGYIDFYFGLSRGWWLFEDTDLRADSPLLPLEAWKRLLAEEGFDRNAAFQETLEGQEPVHSVFLARKSATEADATPPLDQLSVREPRCWLIFRDGQKGGGIPIVETLIARLEAAGDRIVTVAPGDAFARVDSDRYTVAPGSRNDYSELFRALRTEGTPVSDVMHAWGIVSPAPEVAAVLPHLERRALSLVFLTGAIGDSRLAELPRLWVLTSGAFGGLGGCSSLHPVQATACGVVRTLMNEEFRLDCRLIDVDLGDPTDPLSAQIARELEDLGNETEIILRGGARYGNRFCAVPLGVRPDAEDGFRLLLSGSGRTSAIRPAVTDRQQPQPDEVEVRVHAAGVNFHDVLIAAGALSEDVIEDGFPGAALGMEFAGEVSSVGSGKLDLSVGDPVFGIAAASFGSHVTTRASSLWRKPDGASFAEVATLPVVIFTTYYALHHLARLRPGERVLIHGAAGGVGLAAIQYAQWKGAEIYATAGTDEKRSLVRALGVAHVYNSRTLAFAEEIRNDTNGEGVDVVLNSIAGDAIECGMSLLRSGGRFLELGKRDIYSNHRLGLRNFARNVSFFGVDLETLVDERTGLVFEIEEELEALMEQGVFRPLPYRLFPAERASEACLYMQQSRHVGKVVLNLADARPPLQKSVDGRLKIDPNGTYLITGGFGGFGLATASWLAGRGARHLTLLGRSGASAEARERIKSLRHSGVEVREVAADVADEPTIRALVEEIDSSPQPLRGVVHAAMVLSDVFLLHMTREQWEAAIHPKVLGAWNLHQATLASSLDFFVLFSSGAAALGNPGQANYTAANLFLETLASYRRASKLPALCVGWGAIEDVGLIFTHPELRKLVRERIGLETMTSAEALDILEKMLLCETEVACAARVDWEIFRTSKHHRLDVPLFEEVESAELVGGANIEGLDPFDMSSLKGLPRAEAVDAVSEYLLKLVASVLRLPSEQLDLQVPLLDLGIDSLMALELETVIESHLDVTLPSMEITDSPGVRNMAGQVVDAVLPGSSEEPEPADDDD